MAIKCLKVRRAGAGGRAVVQGGRKVKQTKKHFYGEKVGSFSTMFHMVTVGEIRKVFSDQSAS